MWRGVVTVCGGVWFEGVSCVVFVFRSLKKNINDLSHKISDMASATECDQQLMDLLSDELQKQQEQLVEAK